MHDHIKLALLETVARIGQERPDLASQAMRIVNTLVMGNVVGLEPLVHEVCLAFSSKIDAIKIHRARTGASLKESKEFLEAAMDKVRSSVQFPGSSLPKE